MMPSTTLGLDNPSRTEYRRPTRKAVEGAARRTLRGLDCSPLQMTQGVYVLRLLSDSRQKPERPSSVPGTDPMSKVLRVFVIAL